jgi:two-component system, sensor histidine kinase and response regulator
MTAFYGRRSWQNVASLIDRYGVLQNHEIPMQTAQKRALWALISVHRITFEGASALFTALHDLTKQKRAEEQLRELTTSLERHVDERTHALQMANEKLQEHDRLKSAFVSIVSHELRTPMAAIKGYVENMLEGMPGPLTEKQTYYLTRVLHNVERLTRMLDDLLDLSRIEAGRVELNVGPVLLQELIVEVVEGFQSIARRKLITLHAYADKTLPVIRADRDKLHQIFTNLLQNAIKCTRNGGEVELNAKVRDDAVLVCVSDNGIGIHPDELEKIFDTFYRGRGVSEDARGAGLGLAITKRFVELHGGRIWVESSLSEGSQFYLTIPIRF